MGTGAPLVEIGVRAISKSADLLSTDGVLAPMIVIRTALGLLSRCKSKANGHGKPTDSSRIRAHATCQLSSPRHVLS